MKNKKRLVIGGCIVGVVLLAAAGWKVMGQDQKNPESQNVASAKVEKLDISKNIQGKGTQPKAEGAVISDIEIKTEGTVTTLGFTAIYPATEEQQEEKPQPEQPQQPDSEAAGSEQGAEQPAEQPAGQAVGGQEESDAYGGSSGGSVSISSGNAGSTVSGAADESTKEINTELVSIFTIASGDNMKVNIQVDEMDVLSVASGQKAEITLNALPGTKFQGKITHLNKVGTANNGVTKYPVEITVAKNEKMLSGMNVAALVLVEERKGVAAIPASAVLEEGGKSYVYTAVNDKTGIPEGKKEVTTGLTDGMNIEITKGIEDGTSVYYQAPETPSVSETAVDEEIAL